MKGSGRLAEMRHRRGVGRWLRLSPPSHSSTRPGAAAGLNTEGSTSVLPGMLCPAETPSVCPCPAQPRPGGH